MRKYTKIFLIFTLLSLALISVKFYFDLKDMQKLQNMVVEDETKALSSLFISFRRTYQDIFVKEHIEIDDKTINLLPVRTNQTISEEFSKYMNDKAVIRTVSDRPRNIINKANNYEMKIIKYFKDNPEKKSFFEKKNDADFYFAQPLYVTKNCLKCHGKKSEAIKTIQERYDTAFDYELGDLRGILTIKVSKNKMINNIYNNFYRDIITAIFVFFLFFIAMYLVIEIIIKYEKMHAKILEDKVNEQIKELREKDNILLHQSKMAEMGEMLANIAHQWRQPLTAISTRASGVKLQNELQILNSETINESMDNIIKNTQYLSQTIDDFRSFIKGDKTLNEFYLLKNIDTSLEILRGTLNKYNINIVKNVDGNIKIKSFENELIQVLINILNNAKDALVEKNIEEKFIFIDVKQKDNNIIIQIKDNAKGIKDEIIEKIFDPYFTTKHQSQGTGLGLFMTHRLINESLKGEIKVTNISFEHENNQFLGAMFEITLPKYF